MKNIRKKIVSALYPTTPEARKEDQKIKRAKYMRTEYKKQRKRVDCILTNDEYKQLSKQARKHWLKVTSFLRESAFAYIDQKYLIPDDIQEKLEQNMFLLRNIANNINQIAKHTNTTHKLSILNAYKMKRLIHGLEDQIKKFITSPKKENDYQIMEREDKSK